MILRTKKIVEDGNQIIFKTNLIPEDDVDRKILTELESNKMPVINKMMEDLVANEASDLREKYKPTWEFDFRKSEGESAYFVHLKRSKG
jgi:hypothetical protein